MKHFRKDYQERIIDTAGLIPENEPVFLLRAQDAYALHALGAYLDAIRKDGGIHPDFIARIETMYGAFVDWPTHKLPDAPNEPSDPNG